MFRPLNEKEEMVLRRHQKKGRAHLQLNYADRKVRYDQQGNFVVAVVKCKGSVYTGVAKFNPEDPSFNPTVGKSLAFSRAVQK